MKERRGDGETERRRDEETKRRSEIYIRENHIVLGKKFVVSHMKNYR